jgi:RNA polymerase sigma-70 factor (ECF subfamily)
MPPERNNEDAGRLFQVLVAALRAGDNEAWKQVASRYTNRLVALARSRLGQRLRQKVDSEEVVQSVYRSFYKGLKEGRYALQGWDALMGMLVVLTMRRCCRWHAHYHTQSRNVEREVALGSGAEQNAPVEVPTGREPVDRNPTPEEAAMLIETIQETLKDLDERERQIVLLGLLGDSEQEISQQVGRTQYTVRQVCNQYADLIRGLHDQAEGSTN